MLYAHTHTNHKEMSVAQWMGRLYTVRDFASSNPVIKCLFICLFFFIQLFEYMHYQFEIISLAENRVNYSKHPHPVELTHSVLSRILCVFVFANFPFKGHFV